MQCLWQKKNQIQWEVASIPFFLFLSNISLFSVMGSKMRPMDTILPLLIIWFFVRKKKLHISSHMLIMLLIPLLGVKNALDVVEWAISYCFYFIEVIFLYLIFDNSCKITIDTKQKTVFLLFDLFKVAVWFGILQFVLANFLDSMVLYNCFGKFQYHPNYENELSGITRATSVFYEPSVYGWVSVSVFAINNYLKHPKYYRSTNIYVLIALITSFSASAIAGFGMACVMLFLTKKNTRKKMTIGLFAIILLGLCFFVGLNLISFLRFDSIFIEGTSGYNRVAYPFLAMLETICHYPLFGRGLGQIGIEDINIKHYDTIYNALFGIVVTFGLSSLFLYGQMVRGFKKWYIMDRGSVVFIVCIFYLLISNGSFLTLEFPMVAVMYSFAVEIKRSKSLNAHVDVADNFTRRNTYERISKRNCSSIQ